jgi:hypothetical protein
MLNMAAWVQQRLAFPPLVNEVVIGLRQKNLFNAAELTQDSALATHLRDQLTTCAADVLFQMRLVRREQNHLTFRAMIWWRPS